MMRWFPRIGMLFVALVVALGGIVACNSLPQPAQDPPAQALRIATYNVHYIWLDRATGDWSVGDWDRRKGALQSAFRSLEADVVGFQEMESFGRTSAPANLTLDYLIEQNRPQYDAYRAKAS